MSNFLNDNWVLYYHDSFDNDWGKTSYKEICKIDTIENFWKVSQLVEDKIEYGMFFLFREHVFPLWDEPENKDGGALSLKILKNDGYQVWLDTSIKMLSENLLIPSINKQFCEKVFGISIVPKKTFVINKIWVKDASIADPKKFQFMPKYHGKILYKPHVDN
jgi:hypothetical protein